MASVRKSHARLAQLWQFPLLIFSLTLFGVAAYLFIDPKPGLSIDDKIGIARTFLSQDRPEAALAQLNQIMAAEKLDAPHEGKIHLMMAESLENAQTQRKISIARNHQLIIEQTLQAAAAGAKLDATAYRRVGNSYDALGQPAKALENYRKAIGLDPDHALSLQRRVIDLQLDRDDTAAAESSLDDYLKDNRLTDSERSLALGQKAQLLIDDNRFIDAKILLDEALKLAGDQTSQGEVNYRLGYCAYKLNDPDEAERYLRVARDLLQVRHPLDADACYWLGKISQERNDPAAALSFFQVVMTSHIDSKIMPLAHLGRGMCRILLKDEDAGLTDLHDLVNEIQERASRAKLKEPVLAGLRQTSQLLAARENYKGALEVLEYEQTLQPEPAPGFFERLGAVYERRADQIEKTLADAAPADRIKRTKEAQQTRIHAGDAYIAYSQKLTLTDDTGYGDAMWHGIDLYDRSADVSDAISALELFVTERPDDRLTPDALLRLGLAYQAAGQFDKAISSFQRNQFRYPNSLAASKSAVPLAQAYMAKGPEHYGKAETVLISVVENNRNLDPDAEEFRQALFDLGQLYYRTGRFEEAISRLSEFSERYPSDDRMGQLLFLMGDSHRKSASLLETRLASAKVAASQSTTKPATDVMAGIVEAETARRDRLTKAKDLFDRVLEHYRTRVAATDVDKLYLKLSHFYRADCLYDLGNYEDAAKLYEAAAFRYQEDPSALAAYVQIVNADCAMGKLEEARTANERAKWLVRRIPSEAFSDSMPKAYWEQLFKWTGDSGLW